MNDREINEFLNYIKTEDKELYKSLEKINKKYWSEINSFKNGYRERFINELGIPKVALKCKVYDSPNCDRISFGREHTYDKEDHWYLDYSKGHSLGIDVSWDAEDFLDILISIEEESKHKIVKIGFNDRYGYADENNNIVFEKIENRVSLGEDGDSFNIQLDDGNYYHLYFCESK